ncbi:cytochrome-c peroxidase [Foetidibacter luteolus]|uniref:cytochrome-c peroxidase n=1 Tax=Foetidibacter luteolus TaxID=2608880 RepID=UPI00129A63F8|nr:cytochrome-c peroxidase [Foetidibacter luteolus]
MKRLAVLILLCAAVMAGASFIHRQRINKTTPLQFTVPQGWPQPVYDFKQNPLTKEGFQLGRKLFYDGRLSADGNFACASCHQQFSAFATYDHNLSHGINNTLTTRNAPGLFNLAWQKELMLDGGINHLDLQPLAPITAANEMGETIENVINKLNKDAEYRKLFKTAFGDAVINTRRMNMALSQFVLMMVSNNSKYDKVMRGEANFNLPEKLGYDIFRKKCASCHTEPMFTDYSYRNIGLDLDTTINDFGRMRITRNAADSLKFRVPSLRNVMLTAPYTHDGRLYSTFDVLQHYRTSVINMPTTDSLLMPKGIPLSNFEIGQLTAFMMALTDSSFVKDPRFEPPVETLPPPAQHVH